MDTEPVRLSGWVALLVGLALNAVLAWGLSLDLRTAVVMITTMALTSIGGLEFARSRTFTRHRVDIERSHAAMSMYENLKALEEDQEGGVDAHDLVLAVLIALGLVLVVFL